MKIKIGMKVLYCGAIHLEDAVDDDGWATCII